MKTGEELSSPRDWSTTTILDFHLYCCHRLRDSMQEGRIYTTMAGSKMLHGELHFLWSFLTCGDEELAIMLCAGYNCCYALISSDIHFSKWSHRSANDPMGISTLRFVLHHHSLRSCAAGSLLQRWQTTLPTVDRGILLFLNRIKVGYLGKGFDVGVVALK
jgi:hypothetical protein